MANVRYETVIVSKSPIECKVVGPTGDYRYSIYMSVDGKRDVLAEKIPTQEKAIELASWFVDELYKLYEKRAEINRMESDLRRKLLEHGK